MKNKIIIPYFILLLITIADLYLNYNAKDFPEYHEMRVKCNICSLLFSLLSITILLSVFCGPVCICLNCMLVILFSLVGFYYLIYSFYLYFAYDGSNKIKNQAIRILLWISFVNFIINLCSSCCNTRSGSESPSSDSNQIEMEEQKV